MMYVTRISITKVKLLQKTKYTRFVTHSCNVLVPSFFHEALDRLHRQHAMATAIAEIRHIGMLTVDSTEMKNLLIPNPLRCLEVRKLTNMYDEWRERDFNVI